MAPLSLARADELVPTARVLSEVITSRLIPKSDIQFTKLSLSQGLSQTRVGQIIQDHDGYMWLRRPRASNAVSLSMVRVWKSPSAITEKGCPPDRINRIIQATMASLG